MLYILTIPKNSEDCNREVWFWRMSRNNVREQLRFVAELSSDVYASNLTKLNIIDKIEEDTYSTSGILVFTNESHLTAFKLRFGGELIQYLPESKIDWISNRSLELTEF
jgi:hypothetical protein